MPKSLDGYTQVKMKSTKVQTLSELRIYTANGWAELWRLLAVSR